MAKKDFDAVLFKIYAVMFLLLVLFTTFAVADSMTAYFTGKGIIELVAGG